MSTGLVNAFVICREKGLATRFPSGTLFLVDRYGGRGFLLAQLPVLEAQRRRTRRSRNARQLLLPHRLCAKSWPYS